MTKKQPPAPRPAVRPPKSSGSRARYIDFAPRKPKEASGVEGSMQSSRAAQGSGSRQTSRSAQASRSARPLGENGVKVSFSSASKTTRATARVAARRPARATVRTVRPAGQPTEMPVATLPESRQERPTRPVRPIRPVQPAAEEEPMESQVDFLDTSTTAVEEYVEAIMEEEPAEEIVTTGLTSDVNNSPFISSVNVDKRPLSARRAVAEESYSGAPDDIREEEFFGTPHTHNYTNRRERESASSMPVSHVSRRDSYDNPLEDKISKKTVAPAKDKLRSLILVFAFALTIVLGVAVGAFIYLAFFQ